MKQVLKGVHSHRNPLPQTKKFRVMKKKNILEAKPGHTTCDVTMVDTQNRSAILVLENESENELRSCHVPCISCFADLMTLFSCAISSSNCGCLRTIFFIQASYSSFYASTLLNSDSNCFSGKLNICFLTLSLKTVLTYPFSLKLK